MPGLVNYSGSIGSYVDVYCPSRKQARVTTPVRYCRSEFGQKKQPSIEVLPDECLFEILRRVPGGKDRSLCAGVSKRWLMLLSSFYKEEICMSKCSVVQEVDESTNPGSNDIEMASCDEDDEFENNGHLSRSLEGKKATDIRLAAIAVGTSSRGGLGKLSVWGNNSLRGVTDVGISAIAHCCPFLRTISLRNVSSVGDEGIVKIGKECKLLEKLDLCQCPSISNKGLIAIAENCPNLNSVSIESCARIGNKALQAIARFCPKLQAISIKNCPLIGDHGISSLLSSEYMHLSKIKLQYLNISDLSLAIIGNYGKTITNISLTGLNNVSEKGFWVMMTAKGLQKLVSLTITSSRGITDVSLGAMGNGCTNLKQLCLRKCWFISDNGLLAFAKAAGSLESLQLEECNRVTQSGLVAILSNCGAKLKSLIVEKCIGIKEIATEEIPMIYPCKSLISFSIRNCPGFGSAGIAMIGKLCPELQCVDLSGLHKITDSEFLPLLESCGARLIKVNLTGCLNLTDETIFSLCKLHAVTLKLLNLGGCRKLTDASLVAIAENCLLLNELDISSCAITDSGISALSCAEHLSLKVLALSGCSEVSNRCMPFLKKLGKSLMGLDLQHCNSISSSTIELISEYLWKCDILS